jgi:predicted enzyme related to lactoylglutathione lyase
MTGTNKVGQSLWFDMPVVDLADAMSFYEGLLDWKYQQMNNSPLSDYAMIDADGTLIGGLRKMPRKDSTGKSGPILYFNVEALGPKIARAKELGAELIGGIVKLGNNRGSYQWLRDREKNLIGLWSPES